MSVRKAAKPIAGFRKRGQQDKYSYFNGAIYGDYGIGKTYLTGTMDEVVQELNETNPIKADLPAGIKARYATLFVNAEQGEDGLPESCPDIIIKDIYTYKDFGRLYDFLKLHVKFKKVNDYQSLIKLQESYFGVPMEEVGNELWVFEAVIIDSLTEVQKFCVYQLMGLSLDSKLDEEPEYMQQRQWGTALEMILLMVRNFRALPLYTIFIIQQMEDQDERKKLFYRPALQGQAKSSILGFFDFVGYYAMQVGQDTTLRRLFLSPVGPFKAKHRFEKFKGHYIDNPTMRAILDARKGK